MRVNRIFLVGFMGAGKTTVGRLVAHRLGWTFVDVDAEVERLEGRSVAAIFADRGEMYFRARERDCLAEVSKPRRQVVALGGGAYIDPTNRELVDRLGVTVYLEAPLAVLLDRIEENGERPLARDRQGLEALFAARVGSYRMAQVRIETSDRPPEAVADDIMTVLEDR